MREEKIRTLLLVLGICFVALFFLVPFGWMVLVSFSRSPDILVRRGFEFTLNNFVEVVTSPNLHFLDYVRNSFIISLTAAFISAGIGSMAAYAISRFTFRGKMLIVVGVLGLSMFPQISIVGYLYKLMTGMGWINTYQALILPYVALSLPLALWILLSYFSQVPVEIDKAALVDGASRLQTLVKVILPISLPGFFSAMLLLFMFSFNEFLFALMLTTDAHARTVPVGIALFQGLHGEIPWGSIMAASVISCIPVILIALGAQRYIVKGLTGGAVKE